MEAGDIVKVITEAVPKGIVPDKFVELVYQRNDEKWYAFKLDGIHKTQHVIDSSKIYLLER